MLILYMQSSVNVVKKAFKEMDSLELCELHDEAMAYMAEDVLSACIDSIREDFLPINLRQVLVLTQVFASILLQRLQFLSSMVL